MDTLALWYELRTGEAAYAHFNCCHLVGFVAEASAWLWPLYQNMPPKDTGEFSLCHGLLITSAHLSPRLTIPYYWRVLAAEIHMPELLRDILPMLPNLPTVLRNVPRMLPNTTSLLHYKLPMLPNMPNVLHHIALLFPNMPNLLHTIAPLLPNMPTLLYNKAHM